MRLPVLLLSFTCHLGCDVQPSSVVPGNIVTIALQITAHPNIQIALWYKARNIVNTFPKVSMEKRE